MTIELCAEHSIPMCRYCANAAKPPKEKKRPGLKQTRKPRPLSPAEMQALIQSLMLRDGSCVMIDHHEGMCDGKIDAHHLIGQRILAQHYEPPHPIFKDERNCVPLCRHHHNLIERHMAYLPDEVLPDGFSAFLDQHQFRVDWDADNARRIA